MNRERRVVKIYPPDYKDQEYKPNWTLKHPVKVIYDEIDTGVDRFARLYFPLADIGGILIGAGNTKEPNFMEIGSRRLVNLMAARYDQYINARASKDCSPNVRAMGRRLKRILTKNN